MSLFPIVTDGTLADFATRLCSSHTGGGIFYQSRMNKKEVNVPKGRNCSY